MRASCGILQIRHPILYLSILGGVSAAVITTISIAVLTHWFHRRRALASGLCWKTPIRAIRFLALGCYAAEVIVVRGRGPQLSTITNRTPPTAKATINFNVLRSLCLCLLTAAVFSFEFIIVGCAALLPAYVPFAGLTITTHTILLGRMLPGLLADQIGRFNILLVLVSATLLVTSAVWPPFGSRSEASLYTVVTTFGFLSGD
ncbi:hypothetical protein BJX70DRAFT_395247 [Aspergillus crustosus]